MHNVDQNAHRPSDDDGQEMDDTTGGSPVRASLLAASLASELEEADFNAAFHGYDPQEVRALLARAASALRELEPEVTTASPVPAPEEGRATDELAEIMVSTALQIKKHRGQSEAEAAEAVREAREQAADIVGEAERQAAASQAAAEKDAEVRLQAADERLTEAQAELAEAETFKTQIMAEARQEAEQLRQDADEEVNRARTEAETRLRETLAEAELKAEEVVNEARRVAEQTLEEAAQQEADLALRVEERHGQLEAIELDLSRLSEMAADLLSVSEFLGARTARLREQANELGGSDSETNGPATDTPEDPSEPTGEAV